MAETFKLEVRPHLEAASLKVAEEYVKQLGNMATNSDLLIVPSNVSDPSAMIASAFSVFDRVKTKQSSV